MYVGLSVVIEKVDFFLFIVILFVVFIFSLYCMLISLLKCMRGIYELHFYLENKTTVQVLYRCTFNTILFSFISYLVFSHSSFLFLSLLHTRTLPLWIA